MNPGDKRSCTERLIVEVIQAAGLQRGTEYGQRVYPARCMDIWLWFQLVVQKMDDH